MSNEHAMPNLLFSVAVQREDFDISAEIDAMTAQNPAIGAVVTFTGKVRALPGENLTSMTLEHYPGMAETQIAALIEQAGTRWPLEGARVIHRYGELLPKDNIVLVVTASAHRQAAFDAANFLMDWLKTKAPFWKKEAKSGAEGWVDAKADDDDATLKWQD